MERTFLCGFVLLGLFQPAVAQVYLGDYTEHTVNGRAVTVHAGSYAVRFVFYRSDILRVDFLPTPETIPDSSFVVVQDTSQAVAPFVTDTDSTLTISSPALSVSCSKYPLRFTYSGGAGQFSLAEPSSGGLATDDFIRIANFQLDPQDHFYGTGERGIGLDLRGQAFDSYNTQTYGYGGPLPTMNINVPLLLSSRGYGLFFDNTSKGYYDLGYANAGQFSSRVFGGELTFYLLAGETIPDQLEQYTWLTGRQPMPPRWSLGYIQSKFGYHNETEARTMVETMRAKAIPCDAIVLDLYWYNEMGDLAWNASAWPDPFGMMSDFRAVGFKTVAITQPYIVTRSLNFGEAISNGFLTMNSSGNPYILPNWWSCGCDAGLLDVTDSAAREWFWGKHPGFFGNELEAIWTDLGEPERHPDDMFHELGPAPKIHNVYNLLWSETVFNGFNTFRPNHRLFNLTRSGFAGAQRYGTATWSGDVAKSFSALAVQVPMQLNMGMSGLAYHHSDIGGFCCGVTTAELYTRWMQYATLGPVARAHGAGPAVGGQNTEPWEFGVQAEDIARNFIRLRYQLLPYLYTLARENHETGMPLVRPLLMYYPDDVALYNHSLSYFLGDALLVSPVVQAGQSTKNVYLPPGTWINLWDDQVYYGGMTISVPTPLETIPVFVKTGSIIPRQPVMNYSNERPLDTLMISIYPSTSAEASFLLYEDDGETLEYQSGSFARTLFAQGSGATTGSALTVTIGSTTGTYSGQPLQRVYLADIHLLSGSPSGVTKNGLPVPEKSSYEELRAGGDGYFHDAAEGILYVHVPTVPESTYVLVAQDIQVAMSETETTAPSEFRLEQNYPNPFNPSTTIAYSVGSRPALGLAGHRARPGELVVLKVYDLLGREVATLVNDVRDTGRHEVRWNATGVPSGVYFYRLSTDGFVQTRKLLLLR